MHARVKSVAPIMALARMCGIAAERIQLGCGVRHVHNHTPSIQLGKVRSGVCESRQHPCGHECCRVDVFAEDDVLGRPGVYECIYSASIVML